MSAQLEQQQQTFPQPFCEICHNSGWARYDAATGVSIDFDDTRLNSYVARCSCGRFPK